jgi:hypothetical protein
VEADRATAVDLAHAAATLAAGGGLDAAQRAALDAAAAAGWFEAALLACAGQGAAAECPAARALPDLPVTTGPPVRYGGGTLLGYRLRPIRLGPAPRVYVETYWQPEETGPATLDPIALDPGARRYRVGDRLLWVLEEDNRVLNGDFAWTAAAGGVPWGYHRMFCGESNLPACQAGAVEIVPVADGAHHMLRMTAQDGQGGRPLLYQYVTVERGRAYLLLGTIAGGSDAFLGLREYAPGAGNRFTLLHGCGACGPAQAAAVVTVQHPASAYVYLGLGEPVNAEPAAATWDNLALLPLPATGLEAP